MAERYKLSEEEIKSKLKRKYDGYHFSANMLDIYNPFSILNALSKKQLSDYWFSTGTPTYLIRMLSHFDENLNEIVNKYYPKEEFIDYKADVPYSLEDPYWFSMLSRGDFEPLMECLFSKLDAILKYCEIKD